jgi:hypothetical protein
MKYFSSVCNSDISFEQTASFVISSVRLHWTAVSYREVLRGRRFT